MGGLHTLSQRSPAWRCPCCIYRLHKSLILTSRIFRTMSGSNVWTRSREKLRLFPELLAQCSGEAAAYGKCVAATTTGKQELSKNMCVKEFEALKSCFQSAAKRGIK